MTAEETSETTDDAEEQSPSRKVIEKLMLITKNTYFMISDSDVE